MTLGCLLELELGTVRLPLNLDQNTNHNFYPILVAARRAKAMPLIMEDPTRVPDHQFCDPELPINDSVRKRLSGEE